MSIFGGIFGRRREKKPQPQLPAPAAPLPPGKHWLIAIAEAYHKEIEALAVRRKIAGGVPSLLVRGYVLISLVDDREADGQRLAFVNKDGKVVTYVKL